MQATHPFEASRQRGFGSTHWTAIQACVGEHEEAQLAREQLCKSYWYPLYAHLRRSGSQHCDAEDVVQDFLAYILHRPWFERVDRSRGRFRTFLLASLDNFVRGQLDRKKAFKREGIRPHFSLDLHGADVRYARSQALAISPSEIYEMEWASSLVAASLRRLEADQTTTEQVAGYHVLKVFLTEVGGSASYESAAETLGTTVENIKVRVHRLRHRYGEILREEVVRTVARPADVDGEMRHLRGIFSRVSR